MKTKMIFFMVWSFSAIPSFGQSNAQILPVIDMHCHIYSNQIHPSVLQNYVKGNDLKLNDIVFTSPKNYVEHLKAVIEQNTNYNVVLTYASCDSKALDTINKINTGKYFPSFEIWPTRELLNDKKYIETLKLKIRNGEVRGIGEVTNFYTGISPNDPIMDTLYRIAEKYDIPIGVHFGQTGRGLQLTDYPNMRLEYSNPLLLQDVLIKFPKLRIYIMHAGVPFFPDETFAMLYMFPRLYVDISAVLWESYAYGYFREAVKEFLTKAAKYGFTNRIMFGSDEWFYPGFIGLSIDYIKQADFLTETQKRDILYNNAARFLRLSDAEIKKHNSK
jgi:predicted TIM-barrel fold metal-dependent hydrolase